MFMWLKDTLCLNSTTQGIAFLQSYQMYTYEFICTISHCNFWYYGSYNTVIPRITATLLDSRCRVQTEVKINFRSQLSLSCQHNILYRGRWVSRTFIQVSP